MSPARAFDRRAFLRVAAATAGGAALARVRATDLFGAAAAQTTSPTTTPTTTPTGPATARYGALASSPDAHGLLLPPGFRSRVVGVGGERVGGTGYVWHPFPDGGATVAADGGGWIYVSNSEVPYPGKGGAGAIRFAADGAIADAYGILEGTTMNCSGGTTPWGTWLSGEEIEKGLVWECDPTGKEPARSRPALGRFWHECAAADPVRRVVYLSEDQPDGLLYRFRPTTWGDLGSGTLEAAAVDPSGTVTWVPVGDPEGQAGHARRSAPGATAFNGGEGLAIDRAARNLYLTTKGDDHVLRFDLANSKVQTLYAGGGLLTGVDNLTVHEPSGDLFVCEDGGDMQVVLLAPDGSVAPFAQVVGHPDSEITGIAFDPPGTRLYFNSQRAPTEKRLGDVFAGLTDARGLGVTYEVSGPFAGARPASTATSTTTRPKRKKRSKARSRARG